jgi:hypothetical protein
VCVVLKLKTHSEVTTVVEEICRHRRRSRSRTDGRTDDQEEGTHSWRTNNSRVSVRLSQLDMCGLMGMNEYLWSVET